MAVTVTNLTYAYRRGPAVLQGISFSVPDGCFACLLGPNGVGKSTLFKCMLGLLPDYDGSIEINGMDIHSLRTKQLARQAAWIPQSSETIFSYTVRDMVLMGTTAMTTGLRTPGRQQTAAAYDALDRLQISHLADRPFTRISGGERQLVLIARALAQQADVLFMDEPTANLDYGNQQRVLRHVRELARQGYTIIQSTHNPEQALLYADRVLALKDGLLLADGSPKTALDTALLQALYGIQVRVEQVCGGQVSVCVPEAAASWQTAGQ